MHAFEVPTIHIIHASVGDEAKFPMTYTDVKIIQILLLISVLLLCALYITIICSSKYCRRGDKYMSLTNEKSTISLNHDSYIVDKNRRELNLSFTPTRERQLVVKKDCDVLEMLMNESSCLPIVVKKSEVHITRL